MIKKYFPLIALLAAVLFLFWVKNNQRGKVRSGKRPSVDLIFNRHPAMIVYSKHGRCRMDCRHIDEQEVKDILSNGTLNEEKIESSKQGSTYPLEGITKDKQHVRIVFAPHENEMVVVTAIDLDQDWACNCN